jgi:hypothetical protein
MDTQAVEGGTPGEIRGLYDHSIPRHPRLGLALIASLCVLGLGQVVRGEPMRAIALWLIAVLGAGAVAGLFLQQHPHEPLDVVFGGAWHFVYYVVKICGIFDTMRAGPNVAPEPNSAPTLPGATIDD